MFVFYFNTFPTNKQTQYGYNSRATFFGEYKHQFSLLHYIFFISVLKYIVIFPCVKSEISIFLFNMIKDVLNTLIYSGMGNKLLQLMNPFPLCGCMRVPPCSAISLLLLIPCLMCSRIAKIACPDLDLLFAY